MTLIVAGVYDFLNVGKMPPRGRERAPYTVYIETLASTQVWCSSGQYGCRVFRARSIVFWELIFFIGIEIEILGGIHPNQPQETSDQGGDKPFDECVHGKLRLANLSYKTV